MKRRSMFGFLGALTATSAWATGAAAAEPLVLSIGRAAAQENVAAAAPIASFPAIRSTPVSPSVYPPVATPGFTAQPPAFAPALTPAPYAPTSYAPAPYAYVPPAPRSPATASGYRGVFSAIRGGNWSLATALLDGLQAGPLHAAARAEIYLGRGSPRVDVGQILGLIESAPHLPQAAQLAGLARSRGAQILPLLPFEQRLVSLAPSPRRERARGVSGDPVSDQLRAAAEPFIKADQPAALESLFLTSEPYLTPDARAEWQQKTAWTYYTVGNYAGARRLAEAARLGTGEWAVQGDWVLGLTAWRQDDCAAASDAFGRVAGRARDSELIAGGHYWAARADVRCKRPDRVQARMRSAARLSETFYGLLANAALGLKDKPSPTQTTGAADARPNVVAATMLADIGETRLAEAAIRHQARIGARVDHNALLKLAARLNLPSTQYWLAHNGPSGAIIDVEDRYPAPRYNPQRGWRVDKALVFAHTLQESAFRAAVVSPAGATGLMQVRPGTAGDIARARGEYFSSSQLTDPSYNIEYGQSYLEQLRDGGATGGLLPKVIAAYNAGPVPVERWNLSVRDGGDPLLWIESLPYWETRGYVPTILRNYWIYQRSAGEASPSLVAMSQGKWPLFPTSARRVANRVEAGQVLLND